MCIWFPICRALSEIGQLVSWRAATRSHLEKEPGEPSPPRALVSIRFGSEVVETVTCLPDRFNLQWDADGEAKVLARRSWADCGEQAPPRRLAPVATSVTQEVKKCFQQDPLDAIRAKSATGPSRSLSRVHGTLVGRSSSGQLLKELDLRRRCAIDHDSAL